MSQKPIGSLQTIFLQYPLAVQSSDTAHGFPTGTWGPPSNYGPGSIAPNGAPDSIGNGAASCPTAGSNSNQRSGNQQSFNQQSGHQQGGNANQSGHSGGGRLRHHRGSGQGQGGQQPAPTATPVPSQPIGS